METTIDTKSTITLFDRANSQLQNTIFQHSHHVSAFLPVMNKSLHVTLVTVHTSGHYAHIHCLVSLNVQPASMNVSGCNFFCMEEFSDTPLLHQHFHVRHHFIRLPLCCHLSNGNNVYGILVGRFSLYCHITNICLWGHRPAYFHRRRYFQSSSVELSSA